MDRLYQLALLLAGLVIAPACAPVDDPTLPSELSEAAGWLQQYLQIDSSVAAGERAAVDYLADRLANSSLELEILDAGDGRPSLHALLPANRPDPGAEVLMLVHHVDVVPPGDGWRREPFGGVIEQGQLWGRGAIDSKSLGIAQVAALLALERADTPRHRPLALFAAAGEESGGMVGCDHWLSARPELFESAVILNEGGTNRGHQGRLHWWGIETTQKRPLWLEASAADAATLVVALDRVLALPPRWRVAPAVRSVFEGLAPHYNARWRSIFTDLERHLGPDGPRVLLLPWMSNLLLDSLQVNQLSVDGSGRARARIDMRLLPDSSAEERLADLREALGPGVQLDVVLASPEVAASPFAGPLPEVLAEVLGPEGPVVQQMISGVTDSRHFRSRGIAAYGLSPFVLDADFTATVHGRDERIPIAEFDRGVDRMRRIVEAWVSGAS